MPPGHESTVLVHGSDLAGASFSVGSAPAELLVQCGGTAAVRCPPLPAGVHLLKATNGDSEATHVVIAGSFEGLSLNIAEVEKENGEFEQTFDPNSFALLEFDKEKFLPNAVISRKSGGDATSQMSGKTVTAVRVGVSAQGKGLFLRDEDEKPEP